MSSGYFNIAGGTVYDPIHGVDGEVRDIWIRDGQIVEKPSDSSVRPDKTLDAAGLGLPDRDYYLKPDFKAQLEGYQQHVTRMLTLAAVPKPEAAAADVIAIET